MAAASTAACVPSGAVRGRGHLQEPGSVHVHEGAVSSSSHANGDVITASEKRTVNRKAKRKDDSFMALLCEWIVEHQIGISTNLLVLLALAHGFIPRARQHTRKFFELCYYNPETGKYGRGFDDVYMFLYWLVIFTGLRAGVMDFILIPFAEWAGLKRKKTQIRFAEQAWQFLYYLVFWTLGMYIMYNSDYWLNLEEVWTNFPTREIDGLFKWYYLVQFSFCLQQIVVLNIEARRKDYHQMFTHHIVTCTLILGSYAYYQTKVGNVILCIMDIVDLFLPVAKMLNYLKMSMACDIVFGVFMVTWFVARHVLYLLVCRSIYDTVPNFMGYGCYSSVTGAPTASDPTLANKILTNIFQPFIRPEGTVCFNSTIRFTFLGILLALQVITLIWFGMIIRLAYRVITGVHVDDVRSDDEEEEELVEDHEEATLLYNEKAILPTPQHLEEEVGVDAMNLKGRGGPAKRPRKSPTSASAVSLPGHSDRKELLGRIGCDKTT